MLTPAGDRKAETDVSCVRVDIGKVFRWLDGIYLTVGVALELQPPFQPMAALLAVPQGLRHGPQLSGHAGFLLRHLLKLQRRKREINVGSHGPSAGLL